MMVASTSVPRLMTKPRAVELPVDLGQELRRQAKLVDCLAKPPDRGVVGRIHVQRQATKTAERQPVAHRLLGGGVRERVPLLQKNDLEHHERRPAWRSYRRGMDRSQQRLERQPVEPLLDPIQKTRSSPTHSPKPRRTKAAKGHDAASANHPLRNKSRESHHPTSEKLSVA
jgi:hypothetical protein